MKYFLILFLSLGSLVQTQAQKDPIYSTKNGAINGYDPVAYFTDVHPKRTNKLSKGIRKV